MHYIKETNHLNELCSKLNKSEFLSIDTEFIREKTYWPKLCLIQVFNGEEKIIIDPLAKDIDLKSFFEILNNKEIVKINCKNICKIKKIEIFSEKFENEKILNFEGKKELFSIVKNKKI